MVANMAGRHVARRISSLRAGSQRGRKKKFGERSEWESERALPHHQGALCSSWLARPKPNLEPVRWLENQWCLHLQTNVS